ncbi:unnamed protein product [Candidula unifasciata]|uniref:Uncharacterized protein n=1 Tax=Candidula unifasciata TaxID=100452 RepID=A0A8S3YXC4_9EUPU|nr:unnamed protein product [Candidula unifasciata]
MDEDGQESQAKNVPDKASELEQTSSARNVRLRWMLPRTICHGLVIFTLGMTVAMRGPSFIDLQLISGADVEAGSYYFSANALGYVVGALFTGWIYSRVKVKNRLIIAPMLISGILLAATPWCADFVLMLAINGVVAFFWGIYETTLNAEEIKGWEGSSYSAMQFLSFSYSVGGVVGPLIVEPFLAPKTLDVILNSTHHQNILSTPSSMYASLYTQNQTDHAYSVSMLLEQHHSTGSVKDYYQLDNRKIVESHSLYNSSFPSSGRESLALKSNIHIAYFIGGAIVVLCCIPLCIVHVWTRKHLPVWQMEDGNKDTNQGKLPLWLYVILTGAISMFYFFYTNTDDPYSMYLSVFVVSHLDWSKQDGAIISAVFWGCSTAAKLVMILVVRFVNASALLLLSLLMMVVFMGTLTVSAHFHVHWMIWACTAGLALSQAAVFGGGVAWADANILAVDGRVTSYIMIFASLGVMISPLILGATMKELSPMAFLYTLTIASFLTFSIFLFMLVILKPYVAKHYGSPRPQTADIVVREQQENLVGHELKMNNLEVKFSSGK